MKIEKIENILISLWIMVVIYMDSSNFKSEIEKFLKRKKKYNYKYLEKEYKINIYLLWDLYYLI